MRNHHESQCFFCPESADAAIEEHHLVPQRFNGSDNPENTVNLCGSCHDKIEELYDDEFYERLGIAVEEAKQESYVDTSSGITLNPKKTDDRELPAASPHVKFEQWSTTLNISDIKSGDVSDDVEPFINEHKDKILEEYREELADSTPREEVYEMHGEEMPEWITDEGDEPVSFTYEHDDNVRYPVVEIRNPWADRIDHEMQHEDPDAMSRFEIESKRKVKQSKGLEEKPRHTIHERKKELAEYYRIHCGYCHTAFGQYQHADAARHLRLRHGIENPYETKDTTYFTPSESGLLEGIKNDE